MAKVKWKKPRTERYGGPEFRKYATLIGQCALAWNDLHERMGLLFQTLFGVWVAMEVWQTSTLDRAKRKMLEAVVNDLNAQWKKDFPTFQSDAKWLLKRTEALEDTRNNVIHAPLLLNKMRSDLRLAFRWASYRPTSMAT